MNKGLQSISIHKKLLVAFILLITGTIVLIAGITTYYSRQLIRKLMAENSTQIMREVNYQIDSILSSVDQVYNSYSSQGLYTMFDRETDQSKFDEIETELSYEKKIKDMIISNELSDTVAGVLFYASPVNSRFIGSGAISKEFSIVDSPWYQAYVTNGSKRMYYGPILEDYRSENTTKKNVLMVFRPWYIPSSAEISHIDTPFIAMIINTSAFDSIFNRFSSSTKGFVVFDANNELIYQGNLSEEDLSEVNAIISEENIDTNDTYVGNKWFISKATNASLGWKLYAVESTESAFAQMDHYVRLTLAVALAFLVAAILIWIRLSSRIMLPMTTLREMIQRVEQDNDTFIDVSNKDEVGEIGTRFNEMKKKIQDMSGNMYQMQVQEKEAQLSALQSQINPHFLYNTLDNIYCIAQIEDIDPIIRLSESLSSMMRYSMDMKERIVPLSAELAHVRSYVDIINIRFDNGIHLQIDVPDELLDLPIMKLSLQPLVENAWNHGILPTPSHEGTVKISFDRRGEDMFVEVCDDGMGVTEERSVYLNHNLASGITTTPGNKISISGKGSGIALQNVNKRIKLEYGAQYGIQIYPIKEGGCRVIMSYHI